MTAPDLRTQPPPRWSAEIDGVLWLPRFAAKCRAYDAGTLGNYLFGQSPIDGAFLKKAGLTYGAFAELVRSEPDDRAILAAIEARTPGAADRLRRWSVRFAGSQRLMTSVLDIDDGYAQAGWQRTLRAALAPVGNLVVAALRRARPLAK